MINIKDEVYGKLSKKFSNLSDQYPQKFETFPAVQYTEEENNVFEWTDNEEASSYISYRIDIWDTKSTSQSALSVDEVMAGIGFKRITCQDVPDPSYLKHKQMRYEAVVDKDKQFICFTD